MQGREHIFMAADWHATLRAKAGPTLEPAAAFGSRGHVAAFEQTPPRTDQPALEEDILCLHRGGAKRVWRHRDGRATVHDLDGNALTLLSRGRAANWVTEGPINYVHVAMGFKTLDQLAQEECGHSRLDLDFGDSVGFQDPFLASLVEEMLRASHSPDESLLYRETLFTTLALSVLRRATTTKGALVAIDDGKGAFRGGLAGWRLRNVLAYLEENRASEPQLQTLIQIAGVSRAHFFRAFRQSTGTTPARYLERLRVDYARRELENGASLAEAGSAAGFASAAAMSRAFRRVLNLTSDAYRRLCR